MLSEIEARKKLEAVVITNGEITQIELIPAGIPDFGLGFALEHLPDYCRVCVGINPEGESNILIEVWLPIAEWNGNFLGTGNGGYAGVIDRFSLSNGLRRGYATANTDMGSAPDPDELIGKPERWIDFGYRATHLMTVIAKQIILAFYGQAPKYSYFTGGSTGGQQGLMEAQRYPEDYDGILVTAPANNRTHLHTAFIWNWLALTQEPDAKFDEKQASAVTELILGKHGLQGRCIPGDKFLAQPDRVTIDTEIFKECELLNAAQIRALEKIYSGPINPVTGERIFESVIVPGSESCPLGLAAQSDTEKFAKEFLYLFRWIFGKDYDFTKFDFNRDIDLVNEKLAPILNANSADLRDFKNTGGKILMLHGMADPIIPYTDSLQYYERVIDAQNGLDRTQSFFRYFLVPGFAHVFGGPGIQDIGIGFRATPKDKEHDALTALSAWVEEGIAPDRLLPVAFKDGSMLNGFMLDEYEYERPVYAYPYMAVYESGDPNQPDNYVRDKHLVGNLPKPARKYLV
ncbi:tannase/feruloyl esterase family alpha/beta hydrolase [Paenibacillus sp. HN-1]|uniref:tannase/feruloyl esterase family alpha/beta hydrolase n=1 Tax=Paenibacillus TaxID=44249 RepID=UPI001CA8AB91|nr:MULTISPECIES: tannase/feruloyl esterase family alpha/beta hydrolase [Paenibacillus]MBY9078337.1 tannase/feruloyl esterase family alpha/beta hydrolase [Paenibacillus sp. CGMCC 1.18879]MBY9083149.1 tannase/feruloyl esterase family alpha/beta hydrolase [Paenibacillus sinensis]